MPIVFLSFNVHQEILILAEKKIHSSVHTALCCFVKWSDCALSASARTPYNATRWMIFFVTNTFTWAWLREIHTCMRCASAIDFFLFFFIQMHTGRRWLKYNWHIMVTYLKMNRATHERARWRRVMASSFGCNVFSSSKSGK